MKKESQQKLYDEFPLLYENRRSSMRESCMYWGIACGEGWYDILYDLSSKLHPMIEKIRDENDGQNCLWCNCKKDSHCGLVKNKNNACVTVHKLPYKINFYIGYIIPQYAKDTKRVWKDKGQLWMTAKVLVRQTVSMFRSKYLYGIVYSFINKILGKASFLRIR